MIREDLKARVIAWAEARNFFGEGGATVEGQLAKLLEEASELVTDIVRGRDATDSVGDCLVVLTILERMGILVHCTGSGINSTFENPAACAAAFSSEVAQHFYRKLEKMFAWMLFDSAKHLSIDPNHALSVALAEIEPRRGSWSGGVFVKEAK